MVSERKGFVNVNAWRDEVLLADSLRIDGEIPLITTESQILKKFGKPTKINDVTSARKYLPYVDSRAATQEWEYGNTVFDLLDNKVILSVLDFESTDVELVSNQIVLKKGLHVEVFNKLFPESYKLRIPTGGYKWSGHLDLRASHKGGDRRRWFLIFQQERLVRAYLLGF